MALHSLKQPAVQEQHAEQQDVRDPCRRLSLAGPGADALAQLGTRGCVEPPLGELPCVRLVQLQRLPRKCCRQNSSRARAPF